MKALEATVTTKLASHEIRATGFGALATVNGTAKFISSTAVGLLWTAVSPVFGFGFAASFMAAGTVALAKSRTSWFQYRHAPPHHRRQHPAAQCGGAIPQRGGIHRGCGGDGR